ncbi:cupin domain-containing protein [Brevibacillus sp. NRS-1366]|uniref:cupin domain-containing protein n=1 Tax=Brevibacillus sp. NRS-1366 TaxID=3233899 RepID=UPI003D1C8AF1
MSEQTTEIISYMEFIKRARKPMVRPGIWKWKDILPRLMESKDSGHSLTKGRGEVSLIHKDTGELCGVSPTMNVAIQVLKPGFHNEPHRHTNVALFIVFEGQGYSMVGGEKIEWEKGDLVVAPAWATHEHCNTSETEDAILITIQDVPLVTHMGVMFLEEPIGDQPRHIVKK